ncbi:MAG: Spy0128 family protein, partial [Raoultibacter sp.]
MVGTENGGRPDVSVVQEAPEYIESSEDAQSPDSPREVVDVNVPSSYSITYRVAEDDTPLNPEDNIIKSVAFIIDADESTSNLAKQSAELGSYMPGLDEIQPFVAALNNRYERDEDYKIIGWVNPNQNPAPNIGAGEDYVIYTDNQELYLNEPGFADIAQLELQGDTVLEARFVVQSWQPSYLGVSQNNEPEESQIAGSGVSSTDGDEEGAEENDSLSVEKDEIVTEVVSTLLALFGGISLLSSDMPITVTGATFTSSDFTTENPPYEILTSKKIRLDINWKVAAADMGSIEINTPYGISMHHDGMQFSNVTPTTFNIAIDEETVIENAGTFEVVRGTSSKDATLYITFTKDLSALGITEIKNETFWFEASSYRSEVSNAGGYIGDISLPVISVVPREDAGEWPGSTSDDFKKSSWRVTGADCVDWKILVNINELGKTQRGDYKESGAPTSYSNALIYDVLPNGTEICTSDNSTHADGAARELKIYVPILKVSSDGKLIDEEVYQALVSTQRVSIEASDFDAAKAAILSESAGSYDYWVNPDGQEVFLFNAGNLPAGSSGGLTLVKSQTEIAADIQSGNTSVTLTSAEKTATIASLNNIFAQSNEGVIGFYIRLSTEVVNPSLIESNNGEITNKVFLVSNEASKETEVTEENYVAIGGGAEGTLQKDEIEITKVDSEDSSITLDGAIFNLYKKDSSDPVEGSPATTVNGKVKFSGLTKGTYVIKEISSAPGYSLDGAELYLGSTKIESNDSGGYEFTIDPTTASAGLSFKMTNVKLGTSAGLAATKTLNGRDLIADEFGFTAELVSNNLTHVTAGLDEDGKTTTKNPGAQAGSAAALTFDSLTFDAADDYVFVITEDSGTLAGVSYDSSSFYAVVTVTDTGGALSAVVSYYASDETMSAGEELADNAAPAFINSYSAGTTSAGLAATKTLNGRDLIADEFGFTAELVSNNLTHVTAGLDED